MSLLQEHLSVLPVIAPLLAAPIAAVLPNGRTPWVFATLVAWFCLASSILLLDAALDAGTISYALGGWPPPWGIEFRVDPLNAFMAVIVTGIAAITLPYALHSVADELPHGQTSLFYTAFLLCLTGLLGMTLTGDIFNLFVFLEISSLSTYALISLGRERRALTAAYQYLILGTIGATFFLIGIGLLYAQTGSLNMLDLSVRLPEVATTRTVHTAFAFIVVGIGLKLALFPLHLWLPNAYTYAPSVVTVFLAATATKVALYVLLRIESTVFTAPFVTDSPFNEFFLVAGAAGALVASFYAIYQQNVKRILAYSSVAQIGYMAIGIGLGTTLGLTAAVVHVFNHALMKAALFMAVGALVYRIGSSRMENIRGLGRRMPWTMTALAIGGLSLIGVPGTVGFISKWYLVLAALEQQAWLLAVVVLVSSLLAVVYIWKIVEALFFTTDHEAHAGVEEAPLSLLVPIWILVVANLWFGFNTDLSVGIAASAIDLLPGVEP